ncbi:hypothetical protein ACSDR0_21935 [Streptosporangium sp. G11]
MSVTEFAGVTKDKDRGITSKGGLYEFWIEEGPTSTFTTPASGA